MPRAFHPALCFYPAAQVLPTAATTLPHSAPSAHLHVHQVGVPHVQRLQIGVRRLHKPEVPPRRLDVLLQRAAQQQPLDFEGPRDLLYRLHQAAAKPAAALVLVGGHERDFEVPGPGADGGGRQRAPLDLQPGPGVERRAEARVGARLRLGAVGGRPHIAVARVEQHDSEPGKVLGGGLETKRAPLMWVVRVVPSHLLWHSTRKHTNTHTPTNTTLATHQHKPHVFRVVHRLARRDRPVQVLVDRRVARRVLAQHALQPPRADLAGLEGAEEEPGLLAAVRRALGLVLVGVVVLDGVEDVGAARQLKELVARELGG